MVTFFTPGPVPSKKLEGIYDNNSDLLDFERINSRYGKKTSLVKRPNVKNGYFGGNSTYF
jgi:hypothetical protein